MLSPCERFLRAKQHIQSESLLQSLPKCTNFGVPFPGYSSKRSGMWLAQALGGDGRRELLEPNDGADHISILPF
jgi:hypothetical protein